MGAPVSRLKRWALRARARPLTLALAGSVGIHVALGVWLGSRPSAPPLPPTSRAEIVQVEFIDVPRVPAELPEAVTAAPPPEEGGKSGPVSRSSAREDGGREATPKRASAALAAPRRTAASEAVPPTVDASRASAAASPTETRGGFSETPAEPSTTPSEVGPPPRLTTLVPTSDVLEGFPLPPSPRSGHRGYTVRNDGSTPDPRARAEQDAHEAGQKVDGWLSDAKAAHRVASGGADAYFRDLRHALEKNAQIELPFDSKVKEKLASAVASHREAMARYGATGQPGGGASGADLDSVPNGADPHGMNHARAATAEQTAQLRRLLEDAAGGHQVTIVEIRQTPQGAFVEARILRSSGNPAFDNHVMTLVPTGIAALPPVPDHLQARHPHELRSVWEFRGKHILHKKARDLDGPKNAGDVLYLAAMGAASLLSGMPFDEVSGDVYVLDVKNPKFHVGVTLLELYQ